MKKILNVFLAGTIALGFASCDKNKTNDVPENGSSKTAIRLLVGEAGTRDITDGQANGGVNGVAGESKVANGFFMTRSKQQEVNLSEATFTAVADKEAQWETKEAFQYFGATGSVNAALVLNKTTGTPNFTADEVLGIDDLVNVASSEGFTMSSKTTPEIVINPGVSKTKAESSEGTPAERNNFEFTVERLASKVQVVQPKAGVVLGQKLENKVTFDNLRYAVAGGAKQIYLFGDHAGARQLSSNTTMGAIYDGFKSAIHSLPATKFQNKNGVLVVSGDPRDVSKVSDEKQSTFSNVKDFETNHRTLTVEKETTDNDYQLKSAEKGIYFYENSVDATDLNYNDITYVKFYANMKLANGEQIIKTVVDGKATEYATAQEVNEGKRTEYTVEVSNAYKENFVTENPKDGEAHPNRFVDSSKKATDGTTIWNMTIYDEPGTFYLGADNNMYYSLDASRAAGNKTSKKYTAGKMVWKTPANSQGVVENSEKVVKYADTRRNNIYSLSLTNINGIGDNYDPVDPKDPNIEKPKDNPDEPIVDEKDPVNKVKTFIKVKATILKWNLVHRGVVLE